MYNMRHATNWYQFTRAADKTKTAVQENLSSDEIALLGGLGMIPPLCGI